jgi:menaquinone-dependent protoporphyrinogen IX oxidase
MAANKGESMTMNRPLRLSAIIAMVCCAACFSQTDSLMKPDTLPKKVLIAMGKSYMEKAVSAIVKDSLSARGYAVTIVSMKALNDQDRREYRAIILFSAVRAVELTEAAKKFIRSQEGIGEQSNMLICDVYGEQWNPRKEDFSAIASATKNVRPEITAAKIISNFNAIVNK